MKASKLTLKLIACAAAALGFSAPSLAQSYSNYLTTDVSVTFTPKCVFDGASATATLSTSYSAFQGTAATASTTGSNPTISCSRGAGTPTYVFSSGTSTPSSGFASTGITYEGLVKGLKYVLTATPGSVTAGTAGSITSGAATGATAATTSVTVDLSIPAGQAGDNSVATSTDSAYLFVKF